jgi:uncharacterized repeat protein (TIGR03803 family)
VEQHKVQTVNLAPAMPEGENMKKLISVETILIILMLSLAVTASAQTFTTLVRFDQTDGRAPDAPLVQGINGSLYGTTVQGGTNTNVGTIYQISPTGTLSTLYSFCSSNLTCADGALPQGNLLLGANGNLYGITAQGGDYSAGSIFEITPTGTLTTLYSFCALRNCADGEVPTDLIQGNDGNFYGTANSGGRYNQGTFFKITPAGKLTTISYFQSTAHYPDNGLIQATDGNFYGTNSGIVGTSGAIIRLTPTGRLTTVHNFCAQNSSCADGADPFGTLLQATDGNLYGTTSFGGTNNAGTFFRIDASGKLTTLYNFCSQANCTDGENPTAGVLQASDGNFYGTTSAGGTGSNADCNGNNCGVVYQLTPAGALTTFHSFCSEGGQTCSDGFNPQVFWSPSLMQATDGRIFGVTQDGGRNVCIEAAGCGTLYALSLGLPQIVEALPNFGKAGQQVTIMGNNLTGATAVFFNGTPATNFTVISSTEIKSAIPSGATNGTIQVVTPHGTLSTIVLFQVLP